MTRHSLHNVYHHPADKTIIGVLNCREAEKMGVNETPINEVESARRKKQSRMDASMSLFAAFVKFDYKVVDSCLSPARTYCQRCTHILS